MNSILEELYYGNLEPFVRCIRRNSKMDRACRTMAETEEHFLTVLRDDEKEKFSAYMDAANQIESASSLDGFLVGFRLGAKMINEPFISENAHYWFAFKKRAGPALPMGCAGPERYQTRITNAGRQSRRCG